MSGITRTSLIAGSALAEIPEEWVDSARAYRERVDRELAQMKAEIEALRQELDSNPQ